MTRESGQDSQTARVTLALRELLLSGQLKPGERIREIPLAERLEVSRIPLRLALERVSHEGLLERRAPRGFVVPQFSADDIKDAIELRGMTEGAAARLAAERWTTPNGLDRLQSLADQMTALIRSNPELTLETMDRYVGLNAAFHVELLDLSRSRMLRRAMESISSLPFASPSAFLERQSLFPDSRELFLIAADQHHTIVEAIAARDGARAESMAREHARVARRNLFRALQDRKQLYLVPGAALMGF